MPPQGVGRRAAGRPCMPEPNLDPRIFEANLAALRLIEPALADVVGHAAPPDEAVRPAFTRDGQLSLQVRAEGGAWAWFGRSSIPRVRAEALLANFESGHGNVLLPGVAGGTEAQLLLGSLEVHRAVFIWEMQPEQLALAFRLHDCAAALAASRLVPFVCPAEALTATLLDILDARPGLLCPDRILMWPWCTYEQTGDLRNSIEVAWHEAEHRREQALNALQPALAGRVGDLQGRPLIGSIHTDAETRCYVQAVREAWPHAAETVIHTAADVHPLARARGLMQSGPLGLALLVNTTRKDLRYVLPEALPAITWLASTIVPSTLANDIGPRDLLAVVNQAAVDKLEAVGLEGRLVVAPPPCMATIDDDQLTHDRPIDVTILCGGTSFDPALTDLQLPTMARVWHAAIDLARTAIDRFSDAQADQTLVAAESRLGIRVDDPNLRAQMVHSLGDGFATDLLRRSIAECLKKQGLSVAFCGPAAPQLEGTERHFAAEPGHYQTVVRQSKLVIHADTTGRVTWPAMLAAGCGAALLCRRHSRDVQPGGSATLFDSGKEMLLFDSVGGLVTQVRALLGDEPQRRAIATAALASCRAEHGPTARIEALRIAATSYFSSSGKSS